MVGKKQKEWEQEAIKENRGILKAPKVKCP